MKKYLFGSLCLFTCVSSLATPIPSELQNELQASGWKMRIDDAHDTVRIQLPYSTINSQKARHLVLEACELIILSEWQYRPSFQTLELRNASNNAGWRLSMSYADCDRAINLENSDPRLEHRYFKDNLHRF
ncbi:Uncharacterised protein [Actinobacillus lignieresii]|uniref:hypothetical protein n=1 Tax=Actinobacillus lignieresii TaxID=720 RepID=UPI000F6D503E|nr:hypothetical protein [Actinobacillus lignieresii]VEB25887.1 Uncharacterised protein [Actinobacillus lignieresii]